VKAAVGGISAVVSYAGRAPQKPGLDQVIFTVPADAPTGCNVAIQVTVNGAASNPVTMAIAPEGQDACQHPYLSREQLDLLDRGGSFLTGEFNLLVHKEEIPMQNGMPFVELHAAAGFFNRMTASRASAMDPRSIAPGKCTVWAHDAEHNLVLNALLDDSYAAGELTLLGPGIPEGRLDDDDACYLRVLSARLEATGESLSGGESYLLVPGDYTLRGPGGHDVGPFETTLRLPELQKWTNRDQIGKVNRDADLSLTWTGGGRGDPVVIQGVAVNLLRPGSQSREATGTTFACTVPGGESSFAVPAAVLALLPATPNFHIESDGMLLVSTFSWDSTAKFSAPLVSADGQIESSTFRYVMMTIKRMAYQTISDK